MTINHKVLPLSLIKPSLVMLAVFMASIIVMYSHLNFGFLCIITAFVLMQLFFSELTKKALERIFGPTIAAILMLGILIVFKNHYILMVLSSVILLMLFVYYFAIEYFPYSMILGAITIALISTIDITQNLTHAIHLGFYWILNLLIGSFIVLIIDFFSKNFIADFPSYFSRSFHKMKDTIHSLKENIFSFTPKPIINYRAFIISIRVTLCVILIVWLNQFAHWSFIDIQAVIAGVVVSAQSSVEMTHQRAFLRLVGVVIGSCIAIGLAYFLQAYPLIWLSILFITLFLGLFTWLSERFHSFEYAFLQAGVMIPLILVTSNQEMLNVALALQRSLGSLEGGLIAILLVYASHLLFLRKK